MACVPVCSSCTTYASHLPWGGDAFTVAGARARRGYMVAFVALPGCAKSDWHDSAFRCSAARSSYRRLDHSYARRCFTPQGNDGSYAEQ
jgi:hypothetical protein